MPSKLPPALLMRLHALLHLFALTLTLSAGIGLAHATESSEPKDIGFPVALCTGCHGEDGAGTADGIPGIGGQHEEYLRYRLKKFQKENSGSDLKQGIVSGLTEPQIKAAAAYYARLPYSRKRQTTDPEKTRAGKQVYDGICFLCHGDEGRTTEHADYPLLAGQNLVYMEKTMSDFMEGRRHIDMMKEGMLSLRDVNLERITEAVHFLSGQDVEAGQVNTRLVEETKPKQGRVRSPRSTSALP